MTDSLASQGTTGNAILGMFYAPYIENVPGTLTFGDADRSLYTGELGYVGLTTTYPASEYWGIDQSVAYGGSTILSSTAGIVDSGTTMILLATGLYLLCHMTVSGLIPCTQMRSTPMSRPPAP